jgi:hypothetical protein
MPTVKTGGSFTPNLAIVRISLAKLTAKHYHAVREPQNGVSAWRGQPCSICMNQAGAMLAGS